MCSEIYFSASPLYMFRAASRPSSGVQFQLYQQSLVQFIVGPRSSRLLPPSVAGSIINNPIPGPSKIPDVTSSSVTVTQSDLGNFTVPESLDKNCTKTSGEVL